ncbi:two-component sensor histidine kinase [Cellulomonas humilata]|uniref:histidine kinase n=1 Tax=Cellulomonas humilata TaxID=144055 RepID=A0A7Y5ZZX2_9CELL|nr:histidine kinase [Cellulomonas humilata]NUU17231.1 two-component sensor histidine kinase [Cellulomonas humilata]
MGRVLRARVQDDRVVAAGLVLLGVVLAMLGLAGRPPDALDGTVLERYAVWWHLLILTCAAATLLAKRRHPVLTLVVVAALAALDGYLGGGIAIFVVLFDAIYTAALLTPPRVRRRIVWCVVVVSVAGPVAMLATGSTPREAVVVLLQAVAIYGTPLWWASDVRQRTELAELESRRADLERERADLAREVAADALRIADLDRESAVREERARMARDLHDVVAGHLSAVAIHTAATLSAPPDAERDRATLRTVRAGALDALAEMRSMILVLRGRPDPVAAPAGLARLDALVAAARSTGQEVVVVGEAPSPLPAATDQAAFRIVQESLTNAARHAPGSPVEVAVSGRDPVEVVVTNPLGRAAAPPLSTATGLLTMRERAEALGGTLDAGPSDDRWVVRASLPRRAS